MMSRSQRHESIFNTKTARRFLMGSAASLVMSGFAVPAYAQEAAAEDDDENVITVIARKQTESLQEVPGHRDRYRWRYARQNIRWTKLLML